jgi:hypothetical protein
MKMAQERSKSQNMDDVPGMRMKLREAESQANANSSVTQNCCHCQQ